MGCQENLSQLTQAAREFVHHHFAPQFAPSQQIYLAMSLCQHLPSIHFRSGKQNLKLSEFAREHLHCFLFQKTDSHCLQRLLGYYRFSVWFVDRFRPLARIANYYRALQFTAFVVILSNDYDYSFLCVHSILLSKTNLSLRPSFLFVNFSCYYFITIDFDTNRPSFLYLQLSSFFKFDSAASFYSIQLQQASQERLPFVLNHHLAQMVLFRLQLLAKSSKTQRGLAPYSHSQLQFLIASESKSCWAIFAFSLT